MKYLFLIWRSFDGGWVTTSVLGFAFNGAMWCFAGISAGTQPGKREM